ncbi:MAG: glucose-6-phosphate dehydrogenase assembly protein OpcA [Nocardioides sp.]|jgi:glucose-6-phosphate dehydrogenase assembly protein OpcA
MGNLIELTDTNSSEIAAEFVRARVRAGSPMMGMVMTLVVVVDEEGSSEAMQTAEMACRAHPARILGVVLGAARGAARVNAQVGAGAAGGGERALIRLSGPVVKHAASVVLPLLLPDSPVVVWWPADHPADPAGDPLGRLANRRITDAAFVTRGKKAAMVGQCEVYAPGNSDLAWTRITPWRALLAAALDQHPLKVTGGCVAAERISPSADLLVAWLASRLKVSIERRNSDGPGITDVTLETKEGPIELVRLDGKLATFRSPGKPDRPVALRRMDPPELLAEELRHLDEDDIYAETAKWLVAHG